MTTAKSFSLYLAKATVSKADDLLSEKALDLIKAKKAHRIASSKFGDSAVLYTFPGTSYPPGWVEMLGVAFTVPDDLRTQSPCAVLAFEKDRRFFAITFSFGHVYLDDAKTEADFGLRVSINALSDGKLKSVERANIGAAIRDFAQAAGPRDLRTFGFDDALELIRKVSGRVADDDFADVVTGSRALRFTKKIELSGVPAVAATAVELYESEVYKKTAFKIIDFLSPVLDRSVVEKLDKKLIVAIIDGTDEFEIAIPEIMSDDVGTFRFEHAGFSGFHADLSLALYRDCLGDNLKTLTIDDLKRHRVAGYKTSDDSLEDDWPVRDALVGSLVLDNDRYALNEGLWYRLGRAFKKSADDKFKELRIESDKKLRPLKKVVQPKEKGKKVKIGYQSEESYNAEIAKETTYLLMDQKLIQIEEVPGPGVEVCDLLDIPGRRFIHVKKSSRQSSVLSHFFKQGAHSARLFKQYEPFRAALLAKVRDVHGAKHAKELEKALDEKWTVEFQIADYPRKNGEFNIPFFSKLSLKDEARSLLAMEFDVAVGFIKLVDAQ